VPLISPRRVGRCASVGQRNIGAITEKAVNHLS
jgi:hypothetical protein